jgi:cellulose synthase/poly-beta-1,6-N-acetylglucosamine synthase-like glycosyltransferase
MIPCYKEDLEIVQKTVLAAWDATLPRGCHRTIYLCDDGKDPLKRDWVASLGPDVVYVSGRIRKPGEMNGKSGNMNNCARQLYPAVRGSCKPSATRSAFRCGLLWLIRQLAD